MYPGKGTVVLIRPAQTFYERIKFAFETSRITQSFAAGWFNRYARERAPTKAELEGFLSVAFGKMREELMREAASNE